MTRLLPGRPLADVPLDPTPAEGRSWLRRELVDPAYHEGDVVERILDWIGRVLRDGAAAAERTPPLTVLAVMLIVLLLVIAGSWLLTRAASGGGRRRSSGTAVAVPGLTAADLRARAEAAYAEGRYGAALVDAFRATATRQAERGELDDLPGRTAHEVATTMAASHPAQAGRVAETARLFDEVLYGDRPGEERQARAALDLDEELAGRRVRTR